MKLRLLTAAFPGLSLGRVAAWAASERFEALEVACWPAADGEGRRYAGVSHIAIGPQQVEDYLQSTTIDLYTGPPFSPKQALRGYDGCSATAGSMP